MSRQVCPSTGMFTLFLSAPTRDQHADCCQTQTTSHSNDGGGKKKSHISLKYFSSFQQNNKVRKVDKWWCENMLFGEWDIKKNVFNLFSINYYPVPETVENICREVIKDSFCPPE